MAIARSTTGFLVAATVLTPSIARAADGGGESPMSFDIVTWGWSAGIFVFVLLVLWKKAWGPILQALDEREEKIKASLEAAERALEESKERQREHEKVMAEARKEASAIVEEGKRDAQVVKDGIIADARKESEELTRRARAEIERAKNVAIDELHQHTVELAIEAAGRVVKKTLSAQEHEQLIRDTIKEYEQKAN